MAARVWMFVFHVWAVINQKQMNSWIPMSCLPSNDHVKHGPEEMPLQGMLTSPNPEPPSTPQTSDEWRSINHGCYCKEGVFPRGNSVPFAAIEREATLEQLRAGKDIHSNGRWRVSSQNQSGCALHAKPSENPGFRAFDLMRVQYSLLYSLWVYSQFRKFEYCPSCIQGCTIWILRPSDQQLEVRVLVHDDIGVDDLGDF